MAQRSSVASMTIRAEVVESASLHAVHEMRYQSTMLSDNRVQETFRSGSELVFTGASGTDLNISVTITNAEMDEQGNNIVFTPVIYHGDKHNSIATTKGTIKLDEGPNGGRGRTSVWIEGELNGPGVMQTEKQVKNYMVSAVYN